MPQNGSFEMQRTEKTATQSAIEWFKQRIWPFVIGAVAGMAILIFGFGYVSGSSASDQAEKERMNGVVSALTPFCVANAEAADSAQLAEVKALSTTRRRAAISSAGWAVYPSDANPALRRAIDESCADALS